MREWLVAVVLGIVQGVLEWLPVSSEGAVAILLSGMGASGAAAARYALFLHAGTAVAAAAFYRAELRTLLARLPAWRPRQAFEADLADLTFFAVATAVSVVVGLAGYVALAEVADEATGGVVVAAIGALLLVTGVFMRLAERRATGRRTDPGLLDALLVGVLQGVAVLPGVSRSGTTVSALLLRGHDGPEALRLSFVLSIPAALGAGVLVVLDDGLVDVTPASALVALAVSGAVGYASIGALVGIVRRVSFWKVCVGFGALAVVGGGLALV